MRVKITELHHDSSWYSERNQIIGKVYTVDNMMNATMLNATGWVCGVIKESPLNGSSVYGFKYIEVPEPSAMSELAGWLNDGVETSRCKCVVEEKPAPKKLTWIQKIRGYDDLQARCNSAEAMRDHHEYRADAWKSIAREKAGELELMEKVADNWQQKAIEANKEANRILDDYSNFVDEIEKEILADNIGKRLKFSVGHNHVEIVVGNPTTYIQNVNLENKADQWNISRCSHKDSYDWKTGVIKALDNLCDEAKYSQKLRRDLRKALAKKYPEVFNVRTSASD